MYKYIISVCTLFTGKTPVKPQSTELVEESTVTPKSNIDLIHTVPGIVAIVDETIADDSDEVINIDDTLEAAAVSVPTYPEAIEQPNDLDENTKTELDRFSEKETKPPSDVLPVTSEETITPTNAQSSEDEDALPFDSEKVIIKTIDAEPVTVSEEANPENVSHLVTQLKPDDHQAQTSESSLANNENAQAVANKNLADAVADDGISTVTVQHETAQSTENVTSDVPRDDEDMFEDDASYCLNATADIEGIC